MNKEDLSPETPSVGQAVQDLRSAAGETVRAVSAEAAQAKERAADKFQQAREVAISKIEQLKYSTTARVAGIKRKAGESWDQAYGKAKDACEVGETYVKENPGKSLAAVFIAGLAIGWLLNNRR